MPADRDRTFELAVTTSAHQVGFVANFSDVGFEAESRYADHGKFRSLLRLS